MGACLSPILVIIIHAPNKASRTITGISMHRTAGTLRVFRQLARLGVGSGKMALSRPGRAPGWFPIPPMRSNTPADYAGAYPTPLRYGDDVPLGKNTHCCA